MYYDLRSRYQILLEINNAAISKISREDLFRALAAELRKHISYDRLSINLYDYKTRSISYFAAADGINPKGISGMGSRPLAKGEISRMVIQSEKDVIIDDLRRYSDKPSVKSMVEAGLNSTMAFLLSIRGRTLGTIHFSFKKKPVHMSEMIDLLKEISKQVSIAVDNMLAYTKLKELNKNLERDKLYLIENTDEYKKESFFYVSKQMIEIMSLLDQVAITNASVLITGETGTGKEYLAHFIHKSSPRRNRLFVKINCPAIVSSLFESELFGHIKGSFTDAKCRRIGRFEMANGGTIFLDEVSELSLDLQAKLLHVLQDKRFERVGESRPIDANFRVIAATNKDLAAEIRSGKFRKDLYYRLNIVSIHVPPLRERVKDIPYLIDKLSMQQAYKMNRPQPIYTKEALKSLVQYHWPGNVRELKNIVKRMVILKPGEKIYDVDIQKIIESSVPSESNFKNSIVSLAEAERRHIERTLIKTRGVVGGPNGAARLLGIPRSTLQYRLKKSNINVADYLQTNSK